MPSRLKSHIILVLDRLQRVVRVNCLVYINDKEGNIQIDTAKVTDVKSTL